MGLSYDISKPIIETSWIHEFIHFHSGNFTFVPVRQHSIFRTVCPLVAPVDYDQKALIKKIVWGGRGVSITPFI